MTMVVTNHNVLITVLISCLIQPCSHQVPVIKHIFTLYYMLWIHTCRRDLSCYKIFSYQQWVFLMLSSATFSHKMIKNYKCLSQDDLKWRQYLQMSKCRVMPGITGVLEPVQQVWWPLDHSWWPKSRNKFTFHHKRTFTNAQILKSFL